MTDIGRGHLSVKCKVRLVISASLNDAEDKVVTVRPTWEMYLLVDPVVKSVIQHSHGWDGGWLPDPDATGPTAAVDRGGKEGSFHSKNGEAPH